VECASSAFWCFVGYALKGERVVGKLEGTVGQPHGVALMKDGSIVFDVVSLTRSECTHLTIVRMVCLT
jgi:hypothetical protein